MAFSFPIRVYWEDTDATGSVFYANYLKFFERARTEWLRALGIGQKRLRDETNGMFVVTHAELNYLHFAHLDDLLHVTAVLQSVGRASLTIEQQAFLQPSPCNVSSNTAPQLLCEGCIRIGWVDAHSMRPTRIPNTIVQQLSS